MGLIKKFLFYFGENKRSIPKYVVLSIIAGIFELLGVALIYPLILYILSDTDSNRKFFVILIATSIVLIFLFKNFIMIYYAYVQTKLVKQFELEMNLKFMKYFVYTDYSSTANISLHEKSQILNFLIPNTVNNFIFRILNLIVNICVFILLTGFILLKFPKPSVVAIVFACLFIIIQYKFFKPVLTKISNRIRDLSLILNKNSNALLLNLKGIKIASKESFFFKNYESVAESAYGQSAKSAFINSVPPYIVEPFIIIMLFVLIAVITFQNFYEVDKLLASYALIAASMFRLAPVVSRIQVNINGAASAFPYFKELTERAEKLQILSINEHQKTQAKPFENSIDINNITFEYENGKTILNNINLKINKNEFIGISGLSGVGKTTLVDIISGLYKPTTGNITVDGNDYDFKLNIGYIPQEYYVTNASIRENVAFGEKNIDDNRVIEVLKMAQLYDFIINNFPAGIYANPFIDNTGFSQGQKQRLMIARALYSSPDILILDEATSSLDLQTEDEICNVLKDLKQTHTIIAVAHRLSTIKSADRIVFMKNGTIECVDTFNNLYNTNGEFKKMVDLSYLNN